MKHVQLRLTGANTKIHAYKTLKTGVQTIMLKHPAKQLKNHSVSVCAFSRYTVDHYRTMDPYDEGYRLDMTLSLCIPYDGQNFCVLSDAGVDVMSGQTMPVCSAATTAEITSKCVCDPFFVCVFVCMCVFGGEEVEGVVVCVGWGRAREWGGLVAYVCECVCECVCFSVCVCVCACVCERESE